MSTLQDIQVGVRPGDLLAGKYRVERVLGAGGMGVVVAAHHVQLDEKVALKFLLPEALRNPEAVARFVREARAAVKIKSEHVARVSDVGQLENGAPYMVMEFLDGGDLADWLRQWGPLPVEQAVQFVLHACVALAEAHSLGIVHRDLKPANLFCVRGADGQLSVKVLDFGISKVTNPTGTGPDAGMTRTTAVMGSPVYMSPEQMTSARTVDGRTDIWALGIVLYELLTGRTPFQGDSIVELAVKIATTPALPLRALRADVPVDLEAAVMRCLEKDVNRRYGDVSELANALLPFAPRSKASVDRVTGIVQASSLSNSGLKGRWSSADLHAASGTLPPLGRTTLGASRGGAAVLAAVALGVIVLGAAGLFVLTGKRANHDESASSAAHPAASALSQPSAAISASAPPAVTLSPPPPEPTALPSAAEPAPSTDGLKPGAPTVSTKSKPPSKGPAGAATSNTATTARAGAKPNCDPNYTLDDQGRKVWKPECFK